MNRVASLVVLAGALLCAVGAHASTGSPDIFVETYGGELDEVASCVTTTHDGGFVATGCYVSDSSGKNIFVAKFDSQGELQWQRMYGGNEDEEGRCVVETHDGDLIVVGYTKSHGDGADFLLSRFDSEGSRDWTRIWGGGAGVDDELYAVIEASDGTLWTAGFTESYFPVGRRKVVLAKIDPSGTPLTCARAGKLLDDWDVSGLAVAEVFDTYPGLCVAGTVIDDDPFVGFGQEILLAKFDHTPEFMWADRIGEPGDSSETATAIVRTSDACLALAGSVAYWDGVYLNYGGFLLKTDSDAQADWGRFAPGLAQYYARTLTSVVETADAALVAAGQDRGGVWYDDRVVLAKWNLAGALLWNRGHEIADGCIGNSVIEDTDRSLLVAGSTSAYGGGGEEVLLARYCCTGLTCLDPNEGPTFSDWSPEQHSIVLAEEAYTVATSPWNHPWRYYPTEVTTVCSSTIHTVCPDDPGTIQEAIDAASSGDIIELCNGTFTGPGNQDLDFHGKCLTVRSQSGDPNACIIDCEQAGRGFYLHSSEGCHAIIADITIRDGSPSGFDAGGGIYCQEASPTITNCRFEGCQAEEGGDGIYSESGSPTIAECYIEGSFAGLSGIKCVGGYPEIVNCRIEAWEAGLDCQLSSPRISGCIVVENNEGVRLGGSDAEITHCTIACNYNCGISLMCSHAIVENTILWENVDPIILFQTEPPSSSIEVYCSDVEHGWPGEHNIDEDPQFCDQRPCGTSDRCYYLRTSSPCAPEQQPVCGLIGAADVGCCAEPGDSGRYCTADIDGSGDCIVSLADLAKLLSNYGCTTGCTHEMGDVWPENGNGIWEDGVDGDGLIDLNDLAELLSQYGDNCS